MQKAGQTKFFTSVKIAKCAIFSALSFVLYMIPKFPLPFLFPSFLEVNFSDLPALIGGFMLGPVYGGIIVLVKIILKLPFTSTAYVGEFADLLIGCAYVVTAAYIYKRNKTVKGAFWALIIGALASTAVAMLANRFILIPAYSELFMPFSAIVGMCRSVLPKINEQNFYAYYLLGAVLPFNLLRCLVASLLTFLLYKRISHIMSRY